MFNIDLQGFWSKFRKERNVLKIDLFSDNMHYHRRGTIKIVMDDLELMKLYQLIKKELKIND